MSSSDDLREFESAAGQVPPSVDNRLQQTGMQISAELKRSRKRFFAAFFGLSIVGYFVSLSVCSQYSVGLTRFSVSVATLLHQLPDPLCPVVCGVVFSAVPAVFLFVFLDRFQRRRMIVQYFWLPVVLTIVSCLIMYFLPQRFQHEGMLHSEHSGLRNIADDLSWLSWWMVSAVSVPLLFAWLAKLRTGPSRQRLSLPG